MFEIETDSTFHATHALRLLDGSFEPVHRHDWRLTVAVTADALDAMDCVMDFHELQRIVASITGPWEGSHLNDVAPFAGAINPSAERVAEQVGVAVMRALPAGVRMVRVTLTEAPGCRAVWRA